MIYKAICLTFSILFFCSSGAQALELCGNRAQGSVISGKAAGLHKVILNGKEQPFAQDGSFLIAFDRDADITQKLTLLYEDDEQNYPVDNYTFTISKTSWDIQKINGVADRKVTPAQEDLDEIVRENQNVRSALETNAADASFWQKGFIMPLDQYRISGKFGGQRIINTHPKSPHRGMDLAAPEGTPVKAAADGVVTLSDGNFFYSGNMVILDHGEGLQTMYAHLKETKVKVGDHVSRGDIIGLVGHTGRATGPHLHWGASHNGTRFNPQTLLELNRTEQCLSL